MSTALTGLSAEDWTTLKRHDPNQPVQNPLWVNEVLLVWIEPNPNYPLCDPEEDPDCKDPGTKYWCGVAPLEYENDWRFWMGGGAQYGVNDLSSCISCCVGGAPGWIGGANRPPTVTVTYTPPSPTTETLIQFVAQASDPDGDVLSYTWFLDGQEQTAVDPSISAVNWSKPLAGTHTVTVHVSDGRGGTAEASVTLTVGTPPKRYVIAPGFKEGEGPHRAYIKEVIVDGKEDPTFKDQLLYPGSRIKTGPGVEIVVGYPTGAQGRLKENSELEIEEIRLATTDFTLVMKRLFTGIYEFYWPKGHEGAAKFEISTQRAIVGIKGTQLTVSHLNGVTTVEVQEGEVEVTDLATGTVSTLSAGESASFDGSSGGMSLEAALDTNNNGTLEDSEILTAIGYWVSGEAVPGTGGKTIGDAEMLRLIQLWISGESVNGASASAAVAQLPGPEPLAVEGFTLSPNPIANGRGALLEVYGAGIAGIELEVFNLAGQRIFQQWTAGTRLSFQGSDNAGRRLANGVYLFVVTARGYEGGVQRSEVKKLVVLN
ncbi:MAG: Ig-like domain-containing protein [Candidatus Bipolaricaulia bacterium]